MRDRSRQGDSRFEQLLGLWVGAVSAALLLALAWPMLGGLVYGGDDLTLFHLPLRWHFWKSLQAGWSFDWVSQLFCGFYLTGEGQAGTWHPLHHALYRWLAFPAAYNLEVWLSYPWMYAGTVLFLLRSGLGPLHEAAQDEGGEAKRGEHCGLPLYAALFGAMLFTFSASTLLHFVHMNGVAVVAHLPWLLWAIDVAARSLEPRRRLGAFTAIVLLTASGILCGHPQYVWIVFVAEAFWLAVATRRATGAGEAGKGARRWWSTAACFAIAKALGGLVGAVQLLPTLDHLLASQRHGAGLDVATYGSLPPLNIVQFLAPYLLAARVDGGNTHELGLYAGSVPVVLLLWLFTRPAEPGSAGRRLRAIAVFGAAAFLLALGPLGGLYYLQTAVPVLGSFRIPARYLLLVHFAIAVLAAAAFARLPRGIAEEESKAWRSNAWKLVAFSAAVAVELRLVLAPERLGSMAGAAAGPLLLAAAAGLFLVALKHVRVGSALLVLLAAADIGSYGLGYAAWPGAHRLETVLATIPEAGPGSPRVATFQPDENGVFTGNLWMMKGWSLSDGYAGLLPANRIDHRSLSGLRASGVGLVRRRGDVAPVEGLRVVDDHWYAVPDPLPRFRMLARAQRTSEPARDFAALSAADLETTVLVEVDVPELAGPAGAVLSASEEDATMEIAVRAPGAQLLVVADRHHEGWKAVVNGRPEQVLRVNGDFLGVPVPAGESVVALRFDPASLRYGKAVSAAGLLVGSLLLAVAMWRSEGLAGRRRPRPHGEADA